MYALDMNTLPASGLESTNRSILSLESRPLTQRQWKSRRVSVLFYNPLKLCVLFWLWAPNEKWTKNYASCNVRRNVSVRNLDYLLMLKSFAFPVLIWNDSRLYLWKVVTCSLISTAKETDHIPLNKLPWTELIKLHNKLANHKIPCYNWGIYNKLHYL
jgi:hypothetical protein